MERFRRIVANVAFGSLFTYLLLYPNTSDAQETDEAQSCEQLYKLAVEKYHSEEFDAALRIAKQIRQQYPKEPAGVFALLGTYQSIRSNYRVKHFEDEFDALLDPAIELSQEAVKRDKNDPRNYFYLGSAYGFRSMYYSQRNEWLAAFRDGMQISRNFKMALNIDPEFYDAYYGLGLYNYWMGAKSGVLRYLPFADDSREEGIEQIKLAIEKADFINVDAMYGLNMAYFNEGEYEKALTLLDTLIQKYPQNPTLHYRRGRCLQKLGRWQEARESFATLHELLINTQYQALSYQVECLYQAAKCEFKLKSYVEAQELCQDALALEKQCDFSRELDGPIEPYEDIVDELHELDKELKAMMLTEAPR